MLLGVRYTEVEFTRRQAPFYKKKIGATHRKHERNSRNPDINLYQYAYQKPKKKKKKTSPKRKDKKKHLPHNKSSRERPNHQRIHNSHEIRSVPFTPRWHVWRLLVEEGAHRSSDDAVWEETEAIRWEEVGLPVKVLIREWGERGRTGRMKGLTRLRLMSG